MIDMPGGDIIAHTPAQPEPRCDRRMFDGKWWARMEAPKGFAPRTIQQRWDSAAMRELADLRKENEELRKTLEFYRNPENAALPMREQRAGSAPRDGGER